MIFDKKNTNYSGECLCESCKHADLVHYNVGYICHKDKTLYMNVGVCKDYDRRRT